MFFIILYLNNSIIIKNIILQLIAFFIDEANSIKDNWGLRFLNGIASFDNELIMQTSYQVGL